MKIYGEVDEKTIAQFEKAMLGLDVKGCALMPDAHLGYTLPIGGVVSLRDMVVPAFIGYDNLREIEKHMLSKQSDSMCDYLYVLDLRIRYEEER